MRQILEKMVDALTDDELAKFMIWLDSTPALDADQEFCRVVQEYRGAVANLLWRDV